MSQSDDDLPAEKQFPIFDPVELIEASRRVRSSPSGDWRPGQIAATFTVTLSRQQVIGLTWAGHRKSRRKLTDAEALQEEIDRVTQKAGNEAVKLIHDRFHPWLHMMAVARVLQKKKPKTPE
mgnify:CR=1 FL=1